MTPKRTEVADVLGAGPPWYGSEVDLESVDLEVDYERYGHG